MGDEAFTLRRQMTLWACGRGLLEGRDPMAKTPPTTTGKAGPDWRQVSSTKQGARGRSKRQEQEAGARMIFGTKLDRLATRGKAGSGRGAWKT